MITPKYSRYYTFIQPVIKNPLVKSSAPHIFSLITVAIFTVFVLRPTISTILQLQKNIEDSKQTLEALDKKAQALTLAKQNLESMDPQTRLKIKTILPDKVNVISLINSIQSSLQNQASSSALQIQPLTLVDNTIPEKVNLDLGEINFSLNVQGPYSQLLTVLYNLDRSSRLIKNDSIIINKAPGLNPGLSITGKAYYLK